MSRLTVEGLVHTYPGRPPVRALDGADLQVDEGSFVAVLGPSGCGKTTLLRAVAGLERPDGGTISLGAQRLDGPNVHVAPEARRIGLVPQEGALFPHLDVGANLAFGLRGRPKAHQHARIHQLLEMIGLPGYERRRPHELSGGQQQRVALARALAPEPVAVLLDEPFSALDASLRSDLRDEVGATLREAGTTTILVTHDQTEALTMADVVAVMRAGRIVQVGAPADVYRHPVDLWVARFLGEVAVLPGAAPGRVVACRPEQLRRAEAGTPGTRAAVVTSLRFAGADATVGLLVDGVEVAARWPSTDLPAVGDQVEVRVVGELMDLPADEVGTD
jgi:iron(III) transport system ATP-binding protein